MECPHGTAHSGDAIMVRAFVEEVMSMIATFIPRAAALLK